MASRRLKVDSVAVQNITNTKGEHSAVTIHFSRKLTQLEISGVKAVLEGEIK